MMCELRCWYCMGVKFDMIFALRKAHSTQCARPPNLEDTAMGRNRCFSPDLDEDPVPVPDWWGEYFVTGTWTRISSRFALSFIGCYQWTQTSLS
jgi:hypothetical protein